MYANHARAIYLSLDCLESGRLGCFKLFQGLLLLFELRLRRFKRRLERLNFSLESGNRIGLLLQLKVQSQDSGLAIMGDVRTLC